MYFKICFYLFFRVYLYFKNELYFNCSTQKYISFVKLSVFDSKKLQKNFESDSPAHFKYLFFR